MLTILIATFCASCGSSITTSDPETNANLQSSGSGTAIAATESGPIIGSGYSGFSVSEAQAPTTVALQSQPAEVAEALEPGLLTSPTQSALLVVAETELNAPGLPVPAALPIIDTDVSATESEHHQAPVATVSEQEPADSNSLPNINNSLNIVRLEVNDITVKEATIYWQLDGLATGQIAYGTTTALGQWSALEDSYIYGAHRQTLSPLKPDTIYYYRVHSQDKNGAEAVSDIAEFRTKPVLQAATEETDSPQVQTESASEPEQAIERSVTEGTSAWPANANGELPLAGIFYGNPAAGEATTNATISVESSRRFRAQRSGGINSVRFHNRVLSQNDIDKKCERSSNSDSQWCQCKRAGLDAHTCGYSIGNSYSVGNGGLIVVELRPDNGSGLPSDVVLGKTSSYVPLEEYEKSGSHYVTLEFDSVVDLHIGDIYHLVFTNLNPPGSCKLYGLSTSQAASCPRNKGAIGLNGVLDRNVPTTTGRWGPMQGNMGAANLYRRQSDNAWQEYEKGIAFYELYYTDGLAVGESYHALDAMVAGEREIGGSLVARQRFTVEDASRVVDGVWLNFGHSSGADGSALSIELKDSDGSTLANRNMAASKHCISKNEKKCRDWGYSQFGRSVSLLEGGEYTLEISASAEAKVRLSTYQPLRLYQKFADRNDWANAWAEISSDSGKSWGEWTSYKGNVRDLSVLFTIEGMPRQLP